MTLTDEGTELKGRGSRRFKNSSQAASLNEIPQVSWPKARTSRSQARLHSYCKEKKEMHEQVVDFGGLSQLLLGHWQGMHPTLLNK